MKKLALLFLLAIFAPALLLGVLALRTAGRQRIIMQQQEIELRQKETDELADKVQALLADEQRSFVNAVDRLRAQLGPAGLARDISTKLPAEWGRNCIGFAVDQSGILSPRPTADPATRDFLYKNAAFLANQAVAEVYKPTTKTLVTVRVPVKIRENSADILGSATTQANSSSAPGAPSSSFGNTGAGIDSTNVRLDNFSTARNQAAPPSPAATQNEISQSKQSATLKSAGSSFGAGSGSGASAGSRSRSPARAAQSDSADDDSMKALPFPRPQANAGAPAPDLNDYAAAKDKALVPTENMEPSSAANLPITIQQNQQSQNEAQGAAVEQKLRSVSPQYQLANANTEPLSQLSFSTSRFRQLVADGHDGILARYIEDELVVIFWVRPAGLGQTILGAQMKASDLYKVIQPGLDLQPSRTSCLAILDDHAHPVDLSNPGFTAQWKNPFVATELGETLPHWEAALYLLNPEAVSQSAHLITLTLYGLVVLAIAAIAWGSLLIAADTRRQLQLAQKKTDFVSNVSHELKTPLTSIRMFAELLQERRVSDPAKTADYLRIIRLEAERLTRLINNVLDFARLERNQKHYTRRLLDLHPEIERLWAAQSEHLRAQDFITLADIAPGPWWAMVDPDAIVQVIVNLLSNAEKYSLDKKEIELRASTEDRHVRISVLDRGTGVPSGAEKKIFESFYRAHDSLASGIPGSGLGLTLALRIARDHGGDLRFERRQGGGSIFTLCLPLQDPAP